MSTDRAEETSSNVREIVREGYAKIAREGGSECAENRSCCGGAAEQTALAVGYAPDELAGLPDGANLGLSCGNPTALAELREGEVVLDLGSGGGFDVFLAGPRVGPTGRVIGVDMTADMLDRARKNATAYRERLGLDNVEFRLGEIEHLPAADGSVDVVISNCVINLSPDKPQVWREIARVLRPGGRVAVSDLALRRPLPPAVVGMVEALCGCVAGAALIDEIERTALEAGLVDLRIEEKSGYVESMTEWNDPLYREIAKQLPQGAHPGDYVVSVNVSARKPAA
jgi:arsenite methyltransferase